MLEKSLKGPKIPRVPIVLENIRKKSIDIERLMPVLHRHRRPSEQRKRRKKLIGVYDEDEILKRRASSMDTREINSNLSERMARDNQSLIKVPRPVYVKPVV